MKEDEGVGEGGGGMFREYVHPHPHPRPRRFSLFFLFFSPPSKGLCSKALSCLLYLPSFSHHPTHPPPLTPHKNIPLLLKKTSTFCSPILALPSPCPTHTHTTLSPPPSPENRPAMYICSSAPLLTKHIDQLSQSPSFSPLCQKPKEPPPQPPALYLTLGGGGNPARGRTQRKTIYKPQQQRTTHAQTRYES